MCDIGESSVAMTMMNRPHPVKAQEDVDVVAIVSTSQLNTDEQDEVDAKHKPVTLSLVEGGHNLEEELYDDDIHVEKRTGDKIRRCGFALVVLMSIWTLSKFVSSLKIAPSIRVPIAARGILHGLHSSYDGKYVDLSNEQNTFSIIILRRQEEERRFHRDEEARRRERLGKNRHAMMKAQEDKRRETEEQMRMAEEKRMKVLQRQAEEKLLRDEEIRLRRERLGEERRARLDAFEKRRSKKEKIWEEERILQRDGVLDIESMGAEDASRRVYHVRRKAKLHTFAY